MNIVYSCDDNYCPYTGISITSLFESNKEQNEINVFILGLDIREANAEKFNSLAQKYKRSISIIDAYEIDKFLEDNGALLFHGVSRATYYRLFIECVIPKGIDRVFYLDGDTVIEGSLQELESFQFGENKACAMTYERVFKGYNSFIGLREEDSYYQVGVMLIDLKEWRELKCSERILKSINKGYADFLMCDQDLLSHTINENIQLLPAKYNVLSDWADIRVSNLYSYKDANEYNFHSLNEIEAALRNPVILHCKKGPCSDAPWIKNSKNPFRHEWKKYKEQSLWHDKMPIKERLKLRSRIRKRVFRIMLTVLPRAVFLKIDKAYSIYQTKKYYRKNGHFAML